MPINWSAEQSDPAKQALLNKRGTANARPTEPDRGLSELLQVREGSALEKWARRRGYALDFDPNPQTPRPTQKDRGLASPAAPTMQAAPRNLTLSEQEIKGAKFKRQVRQAAGVLQRQKLREKRLEVQEMRDASSNLERIERLHPILESVGREIPLSLKLGWIDKESAGHVRADETARQARLGNTSYNLDEVGLFQISRDERQEILHLKPTDRERILRDPTFAVEQGVRLIRFYRGELKTGFNFSDESPAIWQLTKLAHKLGWPTVRRMLLHMQADSIEGLSSDPSKATWDQIKTNILLHSPAERAEKRSNDLMSVDLVMMRGRFLEGKSLQSNPQE